MINFIFLSDKKEAYEVLFLEFMCANLGELMISGAKLFRFISDHRIYESLLKTKNNN